MDPTETCGILLTPKSLHVRESYRHLELLLLNDMVLLDCTPLIGMWLENSYLMSIPSIHLSIPNLCNNSNSLLCCLVYTYVFIYMWIFMWAHTWYIQPWVVLLRHHPPSFQTRSLTDWRLFRQTRLAGQRVSGTPPDSASLVQGITSTFHHS